VAARQWCWVQVVPLVSGLDALSALEGAGDSGIRNLRSKVAVLRGYQRARAWWWLRHPDQHS
jgi:hypothetical protein